MTCCLRTLGRKRCFVIAMLALILPRHDGEPAPVHDEWLTRPVLNLQEPGVRGYRDPQFRDPVSTITARQAGCLAS